jgi:hypothetical protein
LTGLLCATALLSALLVGLVASTSQGIGAKVAMAIPVSLLMLISLLTYELPEAPFSISPQTTTLVLLAWLQHALERNAGKQPWWAPLLFVGWANLHGGFVAGQFALIVHLVHRATQSGKTGLARECLLLTLCLLAPLVSPYGLDNYIYVLRHLSTPASDFILEWQPYSATQSALVSIFILGFIASMFNSGVRRSVPLLVQSLVWLVFGLQHQRNIALFLVSAAPLLATAVSALFQSDMRMRIPLRIANLATAGLMLCGPTIVQSRFSGRVQWPQIMYPKQEIAYLAKHLAGRRLYNQWNFGAFLIFETTGQVPHFIDGRGATAFPPALLEDLRDLSLPRLLDKYNIEVVLVPTYALDLQAVLEKGRLWEVEMSGASGIIYRKKAAPAQMR